MLAHLASIPWENLSFGVAALLVMLYMARVAANMTKSTLDGVSTRQTEMLTWFGNHLSNMSSSLEAGALAMQKVADQLDVLHDDSEEAARLLLEQERLARQFWARSEAALSERSREHDRMLAELRYIRLSNGVSQVEVKE